METKKWYQSKTIWGIMIAGIGFLLTEILKVPDVTLPENADFEQLKQYADAIKLANGNVGVIIGQIMGIVGTILGIIGRVKAGQKLVK
jgi:hypothetical protein